MRLLFLGGHKHGEVEDIPDYIVNAGLKAGGLVFPEPRKQEIDLSADVEQTTAVSFRSVTYRHVLFAFHEGRDGWSRMIWVHEDLSDAEADTKLRELLMQRWIKSEIGRELGGSTREHKEL